jgi:imidazolonepropionase-like amidohydrolase
MYSRTVRVVAGCVLVLALFSASRQAPAVGPEVDAPIAIKSITVVPSPGEKIENCTVVLDKGRIVAVGTDVGIPVGARELDGKGLIAYAGFVDAFDRLGLQEVRPSAEQERRAEGDFPSISDEPRVRSVEADRNGIFAHRRVEELLDIQEQSFADARKAGYTAGLLTPPRALVGGRAAVVQLGDRPLRRSLLRVGAAQTASFDAPSDRQLRVRGSYPRTLLGVIAHLRQLFYDARWYREMGGYVSRHPNARGELPYDPDLDALQPMLDGVEPVYWEAEDVDEIHRVLNLADEFGFRPRIVGGREAYKAVERLKAAKVPVVVSLNLPVKPREYKFDEKKTRKAADDETLYGKDWEQRPFLPEAVHKDAERERKEQLEGVAKLEEAGLEWCLSGFELKKPEEALKNLRELVDAGLSADAALRALTVTPARLSGVEHELGTVETGKRGNLTVLTAALGEKDARVRWVFVDGKQFDVGSRKEPEGRERGERGERGGRGFGGRFRRQSAETETEESEEKEKEQEGEEEEEKPAAEAPASQSAEAATTSRPATQPEGGGEARSGRSNEPPPGPLDDLLLHKPDWPIETEKDRDPGIHTGGSVLLANATVLTVSGEDLVGASVLIENGKITKIGTDVTAPEGVKRIDLNGYVLMPGIIDPHAHIALASVNEGTLSVTPEVRCRDVVIHDDRSIYDAAAGGCTTIHAMHGSANTIGGQNVVLKMKYGRPASELVVSGQTPTVKFALGENVKRPGMTGGRFANPDTPRRFPGTRMGVEATLRRSLQGGKEYSAQRAQQKTALAAGQDVRPLRRDLRLEALADIYDGLIWINTHCYRADEILRLLDVAEEFGVRIACLHHVLEAYRIMPEIARHGCGTATFSDWWAYKLEAYNAVPQNAAMLMHAGVNSTIKSDSGDLMRHMNLEAAKCMKYGGLTANEALRLITLNAARLFGLQGRIGSIEVGKDGDIAVFNGHPLDTFSHCVMTIIEGEVYFRHRDFDPEVTLPPAREIKTFVRNDAALKQLYGTDGGTDGASAISGGSNGARGSDGRGDAGGTNGTNHAGVVAIVGATLHPISAPSIENGTLLIREGRIAAVGPNLPAPMGARVIDARGLHVWPGLINAATQVGMHEIDQADVTIDTSETGVFQPDLLAVSAMNPHSAMVEVTRVEGITTGLLVPSAPTIAGQAGLVEFDGWTMNEMLVEPRVALVVNLPSRPPQSLRETPEAEADEGRRRFQERAFEDFKKLETFFRDAKLYAAAVGAARQKGEAPPLPEDPRFDAMIPYVRGEKPVIFRAASYKAILEVLLFASQLELRPIILGGRDAWKLADVLAQRNVPVIYEATFDQPRETDRWDANYAALRVLAEKGVKFCLAHESADLAKLLPIEAGFSVAHGLDPDAAVRALTLSSAEILGLDRDYGSLDVGKVASVIVTTDHPCQASSVVRHAFIRGAEIPLESKHTRESTRFAHRPAPNLPPARSDLRGPPSQTRQPASLH